MKELEKELKAMSNARRLRILQYLKEQHRRSVGDIASMLRLSMKSTSRHLAVLRAAGLVITEQSGLLVFYSLSHKQPPTAQFVLSRL